MQWWKLLYVYCCTENKSAIVIYHSNVNKSIFEHFSFFKHYKISWNSTRVSKFALLKVNCMKLYDIIFCTLKIHTCYMYSKTPVMIPIICKLWSRKPMMVDCFCSLTSIHKLIKNHAQILWKMAFDQIGLNFQKILFSE